MKSQKLVVLFAASAITSLLAGGILVGSLVSRFFFSRLGDLDYLEKRVAQVQKENEGDQKIAIRQKLVRVAPAVRDKLGSTRFFAGRLVEIQKTTVASEITGPIVAMPVEVGMKVEKNKTVIAQIDTIWAKLATEQAEKQLDVSRVRLQFERSELDRFQRLSEKGKGMISESDLESQELKVSELEANIKLEEVRLEEAKNRLNRSVIYAPFNGSVVRKIAELGAYVSPGTPIAEIVSSGEIDAELTISENYIDRLKVGDTIPVWIDPLNMEAEGKIFSIVPYGATAARAFPVRIRMGDLDGRLKVGMSVRGRIQVTDAKDSIILPKDAVLDRPDGALVWIVTDAVDEEGKPLGEGRKAVQPVQIVIAARADDKYGVVPLSEEGRDLLKAGTDCVIEGADRLAVNEEVKVIAIDPEFMANLPKASGHVIIPPIEENPFFQVENEKLKGEDEGKGQTKSEAEGI